MKITTGVKGEDASKWESIEKVESNGRWKTRNKSEMNQVRNDKVTIIKGESRK